VNPENQRGDLLDRALRESIVGRFACSAGAALLSAWTSSVSGRYAIATLAGWRALPPPTRVRTVALTGATAMLVHRAMSRLGPAEPLGAVVPFLVIVACALAVLFAGPIARALERLER
jgi:hypothetical protein